MDDHILLGRLSYMMWRVGTVVAAPNFADQIHRAARTMDQVTRARKLEQISQTIRRDFMHPTCITFLVTISVQ